MGGQSIIYAYQVNNPSLFTVFDYEGLVGGQKRSKFCLCSCLMAPNLKSKSLLCICIRVSFRLISSTHIYKGTSFSINKYAVCIRFDIHRCDFQSLKGPVSFGLKKCWSYLLQSLYSYQTLASIQTHSSMYLPTVAYLSQKYILII